MKPFITGQKTKEQRGRDFCVGAKICSGKASNKEEAIRLCEEAALVPKAPKPARRRRVAGCSVCIGKDIKQAIITASKDLNHSVQVQQSLKKIPDCPDDIGFEVCV